MNSDSVSGRAVYILDGDPSFRHTTATVLRSLGYALGTFADPEECLRTLPVNRTGCLLVERRLFQWARSKNPTLGERIRAWSNIGTIVVSDVSDIRSAVAAMKLGVVDFLEKPITAEVLVDAVSRALAWADQHWQAREGSRVAIQRLRQLTPREREVYDCVTEGCTPQQIAERLGISRKTVDVHRSKIAEKLEAASPGKLAETMLFALDHLNSQSQCQCGCQRHKRPD